MPGKPRHGKSRQQLSKKRKERQRSGLTAAQQAAPVQTAGPAAGAARQVPRANMPKAATASAIPQYPYVGAELVRIGIITGLIIAILFVLAMVSSRP